MHVDHSFTQITVSRRATARDRPAHPFAVSPFFRSLPLAIHGLEWNAPPVMLAHPLDDGSAVRLYASVERTADALGSDGPGYRALFDPLVESWPKVADSVLGPLRWPHD